MPFQLGGVIPKGRVKLPEPTTSDYIIPSTVRASSWSTVYSTIYTSLSGPNTGWTYDGTFSSSSTGGVKVTKSISGGATVTMYLEHSFNLTGDTDSLKIRISDVVSDYNDVQFTKLEIYVDGVLKGSISNLSLYTPYTVTVNFNTPVPAGTHTIRLLGTFTNTDQYLTRNGGFSVSQIDAGYASTMYLNDSNTSTAWSPSTANPGEWIYIDLGTPTICGGARVYWGANVPNSYRIQASIDASTWQDVYVSTTPPTANDWTEYSWPAVYTRYLRIIFDDPGANPPEVAEFHYYSRIVERVAAEHGHGSGVERWKRGTRARRGFKKEREIDDHINKHRQKSRVTTEELLQLIEKLKEYIDFKVPD